jgi:four helix bundle protein
VLDAVEGLRPRAGRAAPAAPSTASARAGGVAGWFAKGANRMLHIYTFVLELIRRLRPTIVLIERKDRDLGRQLRRAAASVVLNLSEGMYSRGRNRAAKYHVALGSAREMLACFEVAEVFGHTKPLDAASRADLDRVVGTLVRLVERTA